MGACSSTLPKNHKTRSIIHRPPKKVGGKLLKIVRRRKRKTDAPVNDFLHTTTTCRRSEVSSSSYHLTQYQWRHKQNDGSGIFCLFFFLKILQHNGNNLSWPNGHYGWLKPTTVMFLGEENVNQFLNIWLCTPFPFNGWYMLQLN